MTKLWLSTLALALVASSIHAQDVRYSDQPPPPPPGAPGPAGPGPDENAHYGWADVLRADPVQGIVRTTVPQQQCYNQQVVQHDPGNSGVGTVLGAVVGGVLGSTVGKGSGRVAATVGGAVVGGAVGNHVSDQGGDYTTNQTSRLNYDPGERLRVRVQVQPAD
jgi:hypothetical protein